MMIKASGKREDVLIFAVVGIAWIIGSAILLGPVGVFVAGITMIGALVFNVQMAGALVIVCLGAGAGMLFLGSDEWLDGPISSMIDVYRAFLFNGPHFNVQGLGAHLIQMIIHLPSWLYFAPIGVAAGGLYWITWQVLAKSPLKNAAFQKRSDDGSIGFLTRRAKQVVDDAPAGQKQGTLLGLDREDRKQISISDQDANKHTLVLGTIGSGKTVSVLNFVESCLDRQLSIVYIDGKGDYDLACQVMASARAKGRPAYLFAMNGQSCVYNPLASGGYSAKKDRIVELREWSEDHYREIAEGYMQLVFKVLEACEIEIDLISVAEYMSFERLTNLINQNSERLDDPSRLLADIEKRKAVEKDVNSLREQIWNLSESEIGHLFDTVDAPLDVPRLEILPAIEEKAVVYFCLPALEFPALAKRIGKLVINDLKSAAAAQLEKTKNDRLPVYAVFDEFSVFAGDQVLNLINQGRGAGVRAVLATQSVADIGRAVNDAPDHFIRQVFASCNNYLIHRLNAAEDVTAIVETIGTKDAIEHTAQVDLLGSTGVGSAKRTRVFQVHPDEIKRLAIGEAMFVNKNNNAVRNLLVRHSAIDRAA